MQYAKDVVHFKVVKNIANIAIDNDAIIYGGYPRDMIIHDYNAKKFYEEKDVDLSKYDDPEYLPHLKERKCIPTDIDCFFDSMDKFNKFVRALKSEKYIVQQRASCDPKRYISTMKVEMGEIMLYKMYVSTISVSALLKSMTADIPLPVRGKLYYALRDTMHSRELPQYTILIDALVVSPHCTRKLYPPFNNLDFECNALVLTSHGLGLMKDIRYGDSVLDIQSKMNSIVKDIIARKAVVAGVDVSPYRVKKMVGKGWKISGCDACTTDGDNDDCIICTTTFTPDEVCFKLKCCAAKYHPACLAKASEHNDTGMSFTNTCIHCRRTVFINSDLDIIHALE